jgi:D-alanyl-D-alanine carboxypeptidase
MRPFSMEVRLRHLDSFRFATIAFTLTCVSLSGCGSIGAGSTSVSSSPQVSEAAVDAAVAPYVGKQIPGISLAVGYQGRVIFAKAYGKADLASGADMTTQTRLSIGSLTKAMTSGALLTLERDGLLKIDDKPDVLQPQYAYGNRMTLRQLSTMSGGLLGGGPGDPLYGIVGANTHSTAGQIYAKLNANPPFRPAGTEWDYANIGYWLLGRTIEAATKGTYADAMQARIFGPLGMKTAYIRGTRPDASTFATGYARFGDGTFHRCHEIDLRSSESAGGAVMTASDVIVWDEALRARRLVQGALAKAMFTSNGLPLPKTVGLPGDSYAMGWNTRNDSIFGYGRYDHEGDTILFASFNVLYADGSDVVLLANAQYNKYSPDRFAIADKVHNAIARLPAVKVAEIVAPPSDLKSCPKQY